MQEKDLIDYNSVVEENLMNETTITFIMNETDFDQETFSSIASSALSLNIKIVKSIKIFKRKISNEVEELHQNLRVIIMSQFAPINTPTRKARDES
jgi:hypothetical protein